MKKTLALFVFMLCLLALCTAGAEESAALYSAQDCADMLLKSLILPVPEIVSTPFISV